MSVYDFPHTPESVAAAVAAIRAYEPFRILNLYGKPCHWAGADGAGYMLHVGGSTTPKPHVLFIGEAAYTVHLSSGANAVSLDILTHFPPHRVETEEEFLRVVTYGPAYLAARRMGVWLPGVT